MTSSPRITSPLLAETYHTRQGMRSCDAVNRSATWRSSDRASCFNLFIVAIYVIDVITNFLFFRISSFCSKDKQRSFDCQGQKSVLRALLCPKERKKKSTAPPKSYNKGGGGAWRMLPTQGIRKIYVLPIECDCKGTKNSRYYQRCALFN